MKLKPFFSLSLSTILVATMVSCSGKRGDGPLLKGHIEGDTEGIDILYSYSFSGDIIDTAYEEIMLDSAGNFEFPHALPEGVNETDVCIYVGDKKFGEHLENGNTSEINITLNPVTKDITGEYLGDNTDISEFYGACEDAFDMMKYFSLDESDTTTNQQFQSLLDENYERIKPLAGKIKDKEKRMFYSRLAESKYRWQKARLILDDSQAKGVEVTDYPAYNEIIADINPNDEIDGLSGLYNLWITANSKNADSMNRTVEDYINELEVIDRGITYVPNRHRALNIVANSFLVYTKPTPEDTKRYMDSFNKIAADFPDLTEKYKAKAKSIIEQVQPGDALPYDPTLESPEGKTVRLSSLTGKVLYIDIWATWCGPCCAEIPHLEKLVERFKGNDKVKFISISIDSNKDAWLKKIEKDKPEWPQYLLSDEENKKFAETMGITGIPRFMIIGTDGKFISPDASRPSDSNIDDILNNAIEK